MGTQHIKRTKQDKDDGIDKQLDASMATRKKLTSKLPTPDKYDPRSRVQPSKQKHPPRPQGP